MSTPVNIVVYSNYMCPWCYVATVRLNRLKEEFGEQVNIAWRCFLPHGIDSIKHWPPAKLFSSWGRAHEEEPSIRYQPWTDMSNFPSSVLLAQEAAKCALLQGEEAFQRYHLALFRAYFEQNRDISDPAVLLSLAEEAGLDRQRLATDLKSGGQRGKVIAESTEAARMGRILGVPTVFMDEDIIIEAAVPMDVYRRGVQVCLSRR